MIKIPWSKIKEHYAGEWVELTSFEWGWDKTAPSWGVVRNHNSDRNQLMSMIQRSGPSADGVVLYISAVQPLVRNLELVAAL